MLTSDLYTDNRMLQAWFYSLGDLLLPGILIYSNDILVASQFYNHIVTCVWSTPTRYNFTYGTA